jgi:hypothetical protein
VDAAPESVRRLNGLHEDPAGREVGSRRPGNTTVHKCGRNVVISPGATQPFQRHHAIPRQQRGCAKGSDPAAQDGFGAARRHLGHDRHGWGTWPCQEGWSGVGVRDLTADGSTSSSTRTGYGGTRNGSARTHDVNGCIWRRELNRPEFAGGSVELRAIHTRAGNPKMLRQSGVTCLRTTALPNLPRKAIGVRTPCIGMATFTL